MIRFGPYARFETGEKNKQDEPEPSAKIQSEENPAPKNDPQEEPSERSELRLTAVKQLLDRHNRKPR